MNITEKLGITPETHGKVFCEMLEALIETTMYMEDAGYKEGLVESNIPIIEKATGKTWEEIRGMR